MMTMDAKQKHKPILVEAYDRKITGVGETYKQKQLTLTKCEWCNKEVQLRSLKRHQLSAHCIRIRKEKLNDSNYILPQVQKEPKIEEYEPQTFHIDLPTISTYVCR